MRHMEIRNQVFEKVKELANDKEDLSALKITWDDSTLMVDGVETFRNVGNLEHPKNTLKRLYGINDEEAIEKLANGLIGRIRSLQKND